ncbi:MAG: aldehyde ferredoxin oxidoreductase C-terminal domain-containing protein [Acidimicrobiia bacterium]|nr:aldehyde ferredoxin oxidoreductase C-terminal domain-containing protein [Acidimicrobiia bacterium]
MTNGPRAATDYSVSRYHIDLTNGTVRWERTPCEDLEDALGGIARAAKILGDQAVTDAYSPDAPLIMNLGLLSGTRVMTGLRTYFHGYSPLKSSLSGSPGLMWTAGSGHFGTKLAGLGIDEMVFTGRSPRPTLLHLTAGDDPEGPGGPARVEFLDATDLTGRLINDRIQDLHRRYPEAHFAVIGPAGEHYESVRFASIALSSDNQLKTGDPKPRFCGRGGYGGVMGSKNLFAIAADGPNPTVSGRGLKDINREINLGEGSKPYRDDGAGGTWRHVKAQHEIGGLPEFNFNPPGTEDAVALRRASVEAGPFTVKAESCYLCGIKCHKNVYDKRSDGEAGPFRAKVDYEPWALLSSNLGLYDQDTALDRVELVDQLGMDSISLGVTLGFVMEHNRRHPDQAIAGGLSYGDAAAAEEAILAVGEGRLPDIGEGSLRLARRLEALEYAMQSKGVEYPAYLPHTNPGYPWSLAGGHMGMRTFLLAMIERETGLDYWVDAITNRGPMIMLDDITGLCKFAALDPETEAEALHLAAGLEVTGDDLRAVVGRTYLRGYASERRQGFTESDYVVPDEAHMPAEHSTLPRFNTPDFFAQLQERVLAVFDARAREEGYLA